MITEQQLKDMEGRVAKKRGIKGEKLPAKAIKPVHGNPMSSAAVEAVLAEKRGLPRKAPKVKKINPYILAICDELNRNRIPYITEFQFNPDRKWRFDVYVTNEKEVDYFYPHKIGIEFNGGQWSNGRHVRGMGYANDLDKINAAQCGGYKVLQFTTSHFSKDRGIGAVGIVKMVKQILES